MNAFVHQFLGGIATGCIYASVALALVMIYRSTHLVNFAQGEMAMFSTYLAWNLVGTGVPYWTAFAITVALSFGIGAVIHRVVLHPMRGAPVLAVVVVFVGLLALFNSLAGWIFGHTVRDFASPFPAEPPFGQQYLSSHELGAIAVTLVLMALLYVFFRYTRTGLAMRAVAQNPASGRLVGIRADRMFTLGWGLAAAIGAVAGMMVAPILYLDPNMMSGVLLYAFAAALLGGIDSPTGAVVGGLLVGVLENLMGAYVIGHELKLSVALAIIIGVLLVRPAGLFGTTPVTRA